MGEEEANQGAGFDWGRSEDLTALSADELRARLDGLVGEERGVSYRRRVLQGRIDIIRAELVSRGDVSARPEDLARILLGEESGEGGGRS